MKRAYPLQKVFTPKSLIASLSVAILLLGGMPSVQATSETWVSSPTGSNWSTSGNWSPNATLTSGADSIFFGTSSATTLNNDISSLSLGGITFNSGASAYTLNGNAITLTGNITNSSTSLQTINLGIATTAVRTITMTTGGGDIILGGNISGAGGGITTAGAGTLTLSGSNSYTGLTTVGLNTTLKMGSNTGLSSAGNLTMTSGGITNTLDLAGFSVAVGTLTSTSTSDTGGIITSSVAGGVLTLNEGNTNANAFGGTRFTGSLGVVIKGSNPGGNVQMTNANNTFSGGLRIQSTGAALSTANFATAGGFTGGQSTEGLRTASAAALGTGTITLDNGQLFFIASQNVGNSIVVTGNGGVLHMEGAGAATGGFTGVLTSTASTLLVINSNSGNNNVIKLGDTTGFAGTFALDTTNLGGIALSGSSLGNSNANLLWFGNGTNGGTGRVQANSATSQTYTFGELNNLNSGAVGSTMSGVIENNVAATTGTFSVGDSNGTAATFQGVIRNGNGTVALTKTGANTQNLTGVSTYTGTTNVTGGVLALTGAGSINNTAGIAVSGSGTFKTSSSAAVSVPVNVNGGGTLAGTTTVSGLVTVASGSTSPTQGTISLVDGSAGGTLTLSNASGLTLGGAAGNWSNLKFEASSSLADKVAISNALTLNAGGATITITPLSITANNTFTLMTFGSATGAGFSTGSGTTVGGITLANPSLSFGVSGSLLVSSTAVQLVTSGASAPVTAYWSGAKGTTWAANDGTNGNFTTDAAGTSFIQAYPAATTDVIFSGTGAANFSHTLGANFDVKSVTFNGTSAVTINADTNSLTVESGGLTVQNGAGAVTIAPTLSGAGAVNNAGVLTLNGANNFSGGVTNTGTLTLGNSTALGATTNSVAVNAGIIDLNGNSVTVGALSGSNGVVITNNSGSTNSVLAAGGASDSTYAGALNDGSNGKTLALTKNGAGMLTLSGSSNFSGAVNVNTGTLQVGNANALGTTAGSTTVANGATLDLNGQTIGETLSVTGSGVGGNGGLINSSASAAALTADIAASNSFTVGGTGDISMQRVGTSSGATFTLTKIGAGTLTFNGSSHNNLMALAVNNGTVVLANSGGYGADRGVTINGGTLRLAGSNTDLINNTQSFTMNGGNFDLNGKSETIAALSGSSGAIVQNTLASTTGILTIGSGDGSATFAGSVQDGGGLVGLVKTGTGTQILSGNNTYSGGTTLTTGTLKVGSVTALGSTSGSLAVNGGVLDLNGNSISVGAFSGNASSAIVTSGVAGSVNLTTSNSSSASYAGSIQNGSGTVGLVKAGIGALTLSGSSSYSGGTVIAGGSIIQTAANAIGTGAITLGDGATSSSATLSGNSSGSSITNANPITIAAGGSGTYTIAAIGGADYSFSGNIALNNAATFQTTGNGAMFLSGTITGSSNITIDGAGTNGKFVDFQAANPAWTGNLFVQNKGTWKSGNVNSLSAANLVTMDSTSSLDNGGLNLTIGGLADGTITTGTSSVILAGGATLTIAGSGNNTFSGVISSGGGLAKNGTGTQTLAGINTYTGNTNINGGKLIVNGSLNGSVTNINNGGTLGGNGSVKSLTLNVGGALAPGNGVGTLSTNNGNFTWNGEASSAFAQMKFDLSATSNASDKVDLGTGVFTKGTGSVFQFDFQNSGANSDPSGTTTYTLLAFGSSSGFSVSDFSYINLDPSANLTGTFILTPTSLEFVAVPEPSTWAMMLAGMGMLIFIQRMRVSANRNGQLANLHDKTMQPLGRL